jgi:hypothetical protein
MRSAAPTVPASYVPAHPADVGPLPMLLDSRGRLVTTGAESHRDYKRADWYEAQDIAGGPLDAPWGLPMGGLCVSRVQECDVICDHVTRPRAYR